MFRRVPAKQQLNLIRVATTDLDDSQNYLISPTSSSSSSSSVSTPKRKNSSNSSELSTLEDQAPIKYYKKQRKRSISAIAKNSVSLQPHVDDNNLTENRNQSQKAIRKIEAFEEIILTSDDLKRREV